MRITLYILMLGVWASCNYEKYKDRAVANKGTYWDVYRVNGRISSDPSYSYFCGVNGDCYYYSFRKSADGKLKRYIDHGDGNLPDTWTMKSDTIQLRGADYMIYSRTDKKLILIPINRLNDTLKLIQSTIK